MTASNQIAVALYEPSSKAGLDALGRHLRKAGFRTTLRLPEPAVASRLRYGTLPYGTFLVSRSNGKRPTLVEVESAARVALDQLRTRFGVAAVDVNGTLLGRLSQQT